MTGFIDGVENPSKKQKLNKEESNREKDREYDKTGK
jgi:deferrochelatase/peroxidase EfeB